MGAPSYTEYLKTSSFLHLGHWVPAERRLTEKFKTREQGEQRTIYTLSVSRHTKQNITITALSWLGFHHGLNSADQSKRFGVIFKSVVFFFFKLFLCYFDRNQNNSSDLFVRGKTLYIITLSTEDLNTLYTTAGKKTNRREAGGSLGWKKC